MATNAGARDDGDTVDSTDDDDLAQNGTKTNSQQGNAGNAQQQNTQNTGDGDDDDDDDEKAAAELERVKKELLDAKKAIKTLTRQRDQATEKLTKVGQATGSDDPEAVADELRQAREVISQMKAEARKTQKAEAVREVVLSDEKYAPYQNTVRYIVPTLDLDDEADVGDDGRYDADTLREAAKSAVAQYVKDNPRAPAKREVSGGSVGDPARAGAVGGGQKQDQFADLDQKYNGFLSRTFGTPRR